MQKGSHSTPKGHTRMRTGKQLEAKIKKAYELAGWSVVQGGWPDLLCYRKRFDGTFDVQLIESKAGKVNYPRRRQKRMHAALRELGLCVIVEHGSLTGRPWITT